MGMTLLEKILCLHSDRDSVEPGDEVVVEVDRFLLGERQFHDVAVRAGKRGVAALRAPGRVVAALDQVVAFPGDERLDRVATVKSYARKWNIHRLFGLGEGGMEYVLFTDGGFVRPGSVVVTGDRSLIACGALGALVIALDGEALVEAVMESRVTVKVPQTVRLTYRGRPGHWVGGKDFGIRAMAELKPEQVVGRALELGGDAVAALDMHERLAFAAFAVNTGASQVYMEPDEKTSAFARARSDRFFTARQNDPDARVADVVEASVNTMSPLVYIPSRPERIFKAAKVSDVKIDQVILGTACHGRIESLRSAAGLLREHPLRKGMDVILIPGSQQILLHGMEEGLIQIFLHNHAHIGPPSQQYSDLCHCAGLSGEGRCLSTTDRIYGPGEIVKGREVYYCNPAVAASSAVMGHITEPFEMIRTVKRQPTGLM
jgi:3-isopropylmalate/(R)-2-methylmalate dehydratase large subunit